MQELPEGFRQWAEDNRERIAAAEQRDTLPYFVKDNKGAFGLEAQKKTPLDIAKERHAKRTKEKEEEIRKRWEERITAPYHAVLRTIYANEVESLEVKKMRRRPRSRTIINKIGGGDLTDGSCSSLALAYIGNRQGFDVRDFRGGISRRVFVQLKTVKDIARAVGGEIVEEYNGFVSAKKILSKVVVGKEYYFACGSHAAIVRYSKRGLQFLELQDPEKNGFKPLTKERLQYRFGVKRSKTEHGFKFKLSAVLIPAENFGANRSGFQKILQYINTSKGREQKGREGEIK